MTVQTWNRLVGWAIGLQTVACMAVVVLASGPNLRAAALTWMVIGVPCSFGFLIQE